MNEGEHFYIETFVNPDAWDFAAEDADLFMDLLFRLLFEEFQKTMKKMRFKGDVSLRCKVDTVLFPPHSTETTIEQIEVKAKPFVRIRMFVKMLKTHDRERAWKYGIPEPWIERNTLAGQARILAVRWEELCTELSKTREGRFVLWIAEILGRFLEWTRRVVHRRRPIPRRSRR